MAKPKDLGHLAHIVAYDTENHITVPAGITMHTNQLVASQAWVTTELGSYALSTSLGSYVPTSRTITINGTTYDLSANRSWDITSMIYPAAGIPLSTGSAWGTSITNNSANWNTAYGWGNHASVGYALSSALSGYVPTSRTITINGTAYDLTANRSWTVSGTDATKVPLAGGTMTGQLQINTPSNGVGSAFQLYSTDFHQYLSIYSNGGIEAMVNYRNTAAQWYAGLRTSSQLVNTSGFHFYNTTSAQTVGGYDINGNHFALGTLNMGGSSSYSFGINYWAGGAGYPGYQFTGGNTRFGFSSTSGAVDVYTDGNFYAGIDYNGSNNLVLHAGNYNSYSPTLTGTGASGTWGISISGNSNTVGGRSVGNSASNISYYDSNGNLYVNNPESYSGEVRLGAAWGRGGIYASNGLSLATNGTFIDFVYGNTVPASMNNNGAITFNNYNTGGIRVVSSGTGSAGAAFAIQQVTSEGWTGVFVDFEPNTGWGLYHDNPNNYFCVTAEAATGSLRSFAVPSRSSGNRTAHEKIRFDQVTGSILAGGDITAFSDARAKDNIEIIENAIDKIKCIRGVTYTKINSEEKDRNIRHSGVLAQEVLKVMPEIVHQDKDTGMYSVAYGNMAGLFIEAIKEQQKQIEELKLIVNALTK